jgi:hypothetical protein
MPNRSGVLAVLLAIAAVLAGPPTLFAQDPPPCISCPPGGETEIAQTPPTVIISPADASFEGEAAGRSEAVSITWCSTAGLATGSSRIVFNGVDVTQQFSMEKGENTGQAGCATHYRSRGIVVLVPGASTLQASISNAYGPGTGFTIISYRVTSHAVSVTPDQDEVGVTSGGARTHVFKVTNTGSAAATYNLTLLCDLVVYNCTKDLSQVTLAAGGSATVTASFVGGPPVPTAGVVRLRAARADQPTMYDEGSVYVNVASSQGSMGTPALSIGNGMHGSAPTPSLCLTTPAGPGAYQCGNLRLAHALPSVRTLNRSRTPVLIYNSSHAAPMMLDGAMVHLPAGSASPLKVIATLTLAAGGQVAREYDGHEWSPGQHRRITLGSLATGLPTSLYDYTLKATFVYSAGATQATLSSTMGIVNRSESPFGAGWWLAGLEQLQPGSGVIVWTGGDGAQRRYLPTWGPGLGRESGPHPRSHTVIPCGGFPVGTMSACFLPGTPSFSTPRGAT